MNLLSTIHRISQLADELFEESCKVKGLTARQGTVLLQVAKNRNTSQTALVELTGIDRSTVSDMVVRLADKKLLTRTRNPKDSRAYHLNLSVKGNGIVMDIAEAARSAEGKLHRRVAGLGGVEIL